MSLYILSDEILLDIFDYFSFTELIRSFYKIMRMNDRIGRLICHQLRTIHLSHVDLCSMTKSQFIFCCRFFSSEETYFQRIRHLTLSNRDTFGQIRLFISHISLDQLTHLRQLTLIEPTVDQYHILFPTKASELTHLNIQWAEADENGRVIVIDEMHELTELTILSKHSVQFRSQYCRVEKMTISRLNLIDLIGFPTFFPNLRYLDITLMGSETILTKIHIPLLTVLKLRSVRVAHELCEQLIINLPQLRELFYSNTIRCTNASIFDGHRCQKLIEHLPLLEQFEMDLILRECQSIDICELAFTYQNSFYLSRQWNIICESSSSNSHEYHIYTVPMPIQSHLRTSTDSLMSSTVYPIDDPYGNVDHLNLNITTNWPLVTRLFSNVHSLKLTQINQSKMIPALSILAYLNKSVFLSNIRKLTLTSPCHFDDSLLRHLLQQSALNIDDLDVPCHYLIRLIRTYFLTPPLSIRKLTLRENYFSFNDLDDFIPLFSESLGCLSLELQTNSSLPQMIASLLNNLHNLYSLDGLFSNRLTMPIHTELCQMLQERSSASTELRPTSIRIWQN